MGITDEHYIEGGHYQLRSSLDRRFWHTSGGRYAVHFGVVDDFGDIVASGMRPLRFALVYAA